MTRRAPLTVLISAVLVLFLFSAALPVEKAIAADPIGSIIKTFSPAIAANPPLKLNANLDGLCRFREMLKLERMTTPFI